jgi:hypothetical protein
MENVDAGLASRQGVGHLARAVRRVVVHHQELGTHGLGQNGGGELRQVVTLVQRGHDDQETCHAGRSISRAFPGSKAEQAVSTP